MTTRTWTLTLLALLLPAAAGCPGQTPALIEALIAGSPTVATGAAVGLEVVLTEDGADGAVHWTSSAGQLSASDTPEVRLYAPDEAGSVTVSVTVDCSCGGSETQSIDIPVVGWVIDDSVADLELQVPGEDIPWRALGFAGPDRGWAVAGDETVNHPIMISWEDGAWTDVTQDSAGHLQGAWANAADDFWASGGGGLTYHWDGEEWDTFAMSGGCVHALAFSAPDDGWASPAEGQPYMRRYTGGDTDEWDSYDAPASYGIDAVATAGADFAVAVGNGGMILGYDGGDDWVEVDSPTNEGLHGTALLGPEQGWAVGGDGTVLAWDGQDWEEADSGTSRDLFGVQAIDSESVWAIGEDGTILFFDGEQWLDVPSPTSARLRALYMFDNGSGWIVGEGGTVMHLE